MLIHLLLHLAKSPKDREVRPAFIWAVAVMLAISAASAWIVSPDDMGGDIGLLWVLRIILPFALILAVRGAMNARKRLIMARRYCDRCRRPLTQHAGGWSCLQCGPVAGARGT